MPFSYSCKWQSAEGKHCEHMAISAAGYCRWHLANQRLQRVLDPLTTLNLNTGQTLISILWAAVIIFVGFRLYNNSINHFIWLNSGIYPESSFNYDPTPFLMLLGMSLIVLGKLVSILRQIPIRAGIIVYLFSAICWGGAFYILRLPNPIFPEIGEMPSRLWQLELFLFILPVIVLGISFFPEIGEMPSRLWQLELFLFILPVIVLGISFERRTGHIAIWMTIIGFILFALAGIANFIIAILGYFPYLPADTLTTVELTARILCVFMGFGLLGVSADGILALFYTGSLITMFPVKNSFYWKYLNPAAAQGSSLSFWGVLLFVFGLLIVLYGQGYLLRDFIYFIIITGRYIFGFLSWPVDMLLYMILVAGIHYGISRYLKRPKSTT